MDQVKQFEQQVFAAIGSSDQISPEDQEEAQDNIIQLYQNVEMIDFCISNFDNFENETSKIFTLNLLYFMLKEKFQDLQAERIEGIQQFLFSSDFFTSIRKIPEKILFLYISAQSQLILKVFPEPWTSFFSDNIFSESAEKDENHDFYVKNFLIVFCKDVNTFSPSNYSQIVEIRHHLQQAEISNSIIQYCTEKIKQSDEQGYRILANAVSFCPIDFFFENELMESIIQQGMGNSNTILFVFDALKNIISRSSDPELKLKFLTQYLNPETIFEAIKKSENQDIFISAANLINQSLLILSFLDIENSEAASALGSQYLMLNLNFIQLSDQACSQVVYSVFNYMIKHQDAALDIAKELINRLITNFSEPTVIDNFKQTIRSAERYSNVIINSIQFDEAVLQHIESFIPSFDLAQNPGVCSMLIYLVFKFIKNPESKISNQKQFKEHFDLFKSILTLQPPYSPSQIICFFIYQNLATVLHFEPDILTAITAIMTQIVMIDGIDEAFTDKVLQNLPTFQFELSKQRIIQVDHDVLDSFIQTGKKKFTSAASNLAQCLEKKEKAEINQRYIEFFAQEILENEDNEENRMNLYILALSYLSHVNLDPNIIVNELVKHILENALSNQGVLQNPLTLSSLITSLLRYNIEFAMEAYKKIYPYCKDNLSIRVICNVLAPKINVQNNDWIPELIGNIYNEIDNLIDNFIVDATFGIANNLESTVKSFFILVSLYLNSMTKKEWIDFIAQIIQSVLQMINRILTNFYDRPEFYLGCIDFVRNLFYALKSARNWNQEFLEHLPQELKPIIPVSLNIIFIQKIDFLLDPWKNIIKHIYSLHSKFINAMNNDTSLLDEQFQKLGAPPTFIQRYVEIANFPDKEKDRSMCLFYHDLSICFHGLNV